MTQYKFVVDATVGGTLTPLILNQLEVPVNLITATSIIFRFEKPDGVTIMERTGSLNTTGLDGVVKYTLIPNDLDQPGVWHYWVKIITPTWTMATSEKKAFTVRDDIWEL
jgi:hypothetical protein